MTSTQAWDRLSSTTQKSICPTVVAILQRIRSGVRHGQHSISEAWSSTNLAPALAPLIALLALESYHPDKATSTAKAIVKAYERKWLALQAAATATQAQLQPTVVTHGTNDTSNTTLPATAATVTTAITATSTTTTTTTWNESLFCSYCYLLFTSQSTLSAHVNGCVGESNDMPGCPVCFGHLGAPQTFLSRHLDGCKAQDPPDYHYICHVCRETTQQSHKIFQCSTEREKILHLKEHHPQLQSTNYALNSQRFTCDCLRELLGRDFVKHRCRGRGTTAEWSVVLTCDCKFDPPNVKAQHRWSSAANRRKHIEKGHCRGVQ
jgi:hypothetical protein